MAGIVKDFIDYYDIQMARADPRVEDWLLMRTPIPMTVIFVVYLVAVWLGPKVMRGQDPINLKPVLIPYNFFLVGLSFYMFYEFLRTSLLAKYSYVCQPVDYSDDPLALRMASVCWWFFFSKVIELLDTVFFILRKKSDQVTFLHVYHHCSMIINGYLGARFVPGGNAFFIFMLNCFIHIVMYLYYALAAFGPHMQKYLWWKKYLTTMQLIQFVAFVIHMGTNLVVDCGFPKGYTITVFIYAISLIILFSNFYMKTYSKGKQDKKKLY